MIDYTPMEFLIEPMKIQYAHEIAKWHYSGKYAFYDFRADPEDLKEILDPLSWPNHFFIVHSTEEQGIGYFYFEKKEGWISIGLGLKPSLTGLGLGFPFIKAGLTFARQKFGISQFTLSVWTENHRAIKTYEKLGFKKYRNFSQKTNAGVYPFVEMRLCFEN
ncbi:GNAT family N-acetyltransferase [Candidatus Lokiarchaeum ossiferum]